MSSIFVKKASKLLFWFSGERYFLNFLSYCDVVTLISQSTTQRDSFEIRVAITNIFSWKFAFSVLALLCLSGNMQSRRKRGCRRWGFCVFCSMNRFSTTQSLLKMSEHYSNLDCSLQLFTSVPCCDIFMVCCNFQSYLGLHRILSRQILNFCKAEIPQPCLTAFSSVVVFFFFLMLCFPLPLLLLLTFLVCVMNVVSQSFYYTQSLDLTFLCQYIR